MEEGEGGGVVQSRKEKLMVIIKALDRVQSGITKRDTVLQVLETCLGTVSSWNMSEEVELLDEDECARIVYDSIRVLIQIALLLHNFGVVGFEPAKVKIEMENVGNVFMLVINCSERRAVEELMALGKVVSLLEMQVARNGAGILKGCCLQLPLSNTSVGGGQDDDALDPEKMTTIRINDLKILFGLQFVWSNVVLRLLVSYPLAALGYPGISLLVHEQLAAYSSTTLDTPFSTQYRLCKVLVQLGSIGLATDLERKYDAFEGLLACVKAYLCKALNGVQSRGGIDGAGGFNATSANDMHIIVSTITAIFSALECILWPIGRNRSGPNDVGSSIGLIVFKLATLLNDNIVVNRSDLCEPLPTAAPGVKGKAVGKSQAQQSTLAPTKAVLRQEAAVEANKQITYVLAAKLLSLLRRAIQADPSCCPSLFFLSQCSINVGTQAAVAGCLLTALRGSSNAAGAIVQWADSFPSGVSSGGAASAGGGGASGGQKSKKTSFAPDDTGAGGGGGGGKAASDSKRHRTGSKAGAPIESPFAAAAGGVMAVEEADAQEDGSSGQKPLMSPDSYNRSAVCEPFLLSELRVLFFVLQELSHAAPATLSTDAALKKMTVACLLFESICAAKVIVGRSGLDVKDGHVGNTVESSVTMAYLACHNNILQAILVNSPKSRCGDAKEVENPPAKRARQHSSLPMTTGGVGSPVAAANAATAAAASATSSRKSYLWATVQSLCRVLALCPGHLTQPSSVLLELLSSTVEVALPQALELSVELEKRFGAADNLFVPGPVCCQSWLRDVFHLRGSSVHSAKALTCVSPLSSYADASNFLFTSIDAFEDLYLANDLSSLCLHLATVPVLSGSSYHFPLIDGHLLEDFQRHYMLAFAARHVQQALTGPLSFSADGLEKSLRLVNEFLVFVVKASDTPFAAGTGYLKDPFSSRVMFDSLTSVIAHVSVLLLKSFSSELSALKKCFTSSAPLKMALIKVPGSSNTSDPVGDLLSIQLLKQTDLWIKTNKICPSGLNPTDYLPGDAAVHQSSHLASIVAPSLSKLWNNLKSKVTEIVRVAEDAQGTSNASSSKEPQGESSVNSMTLGSSSNSYWARQASIGCSLLDFLIQFRSVLAIVPLCIENDQNSQDLKTSLHAVTDELDNHVHLLMQSSVIDFHPVQCRLSQLVAISMLDHAFQDRPLMSEDHSHTLFAASKRSTHYTLLGSQVVNPPVGGRFGSLLLDEVALLQKEAQHNNNQQPPPNTQGIVNKVFDTNKRSHDRKVVIIKAFASFFEHSVLLNPAAAVWALSSIIELWIHSDLFSTVARKCFEELSNLKKLIQYLMAANPDLVTEWIVVPLILRVNSPKEKDHSKNVIFNLTVTMFGSTTPDEPAAFVEAGSSNHLSVNLNSSVGGSQSSKDEDVLGPGKFPLFAADSIIVKLAACHDQKRTSIARLRMLEGFDNKVYKDVASWAKGNLIDERPNLFYRILVSPVVQEMDDKDLVRGGLHAYLQECARQLALTVQAEDQTDSPVINVTTKQRVLVFLVWDLGSSEEKHETALKALKVLATILKANKWSVPAGRAGGRAEASMAADLNENVSLLLSESFLYIMSNLLQYKWNERTQLQQEQCVRSLRRLVCLLKQSDLTKFLPKIMIVVDRVLGSDSPRVRFAGVELVSELCNRLPHDVLCDNLSALVVGLFHIAEKSTDSSPGKDQTRPALDDLHRLGIMYALDFRIHEPWLHYQNSDRNPLGLSRDICYVLEAAYAQEAAANWAMRAKKSAIRIVKSLFLSRRRDISRGIQWVTCIPDIPELEAVRTLHAEEHCSMSFDETLKLLIKMFRHDTLHVRIMALNRLLVVIRENKSALYRIIESSATNAAYSAVGSGKQDTVSLLLQELLMLSTRETEEDVLDVCALCLGEMGAIDPAHVQIDVLASSKPSWVCTVSIPPGGSAHSNPFAIELFGDINSQPPWLISTLQLGLVLLEHHLVPSMKSSNAAGADSVGFAIQQILYLIWDDIQTLPNQGTSAAAFSSSTGVSKGPKLPDLLADVLQQRSIFEVTEPYWNTKYRSVAQEPSPSPVYKSGMFSSKWMSMWLRRMIAFSNGKNQKILEACRGVLSKRPALSQFILPTTVVSYLVNPSSVNFGGMNNKNDNDDDDNGQNSPLLAADRAYNDVLAEICHVLKGGETTDADYSERLSVISPEDMAVQAVFSLLDTLSTWSSKGLAARPRRPVYDRMVPQGGGSVGSTTNQTHESVDEDVFDIARKTGVVVRKLVEAVPKMLLASAALSIKAYARALRYLELHLREQPSLSERPDSSIGSTSDLLLRTVHDGSNGQLPPLGPTQIDTLMQIFSKLEAPDALQGLLVVAQKMGQRPSSTNRLLELEHSDDWLGALLEYGLISSPASASGGRGDRQVILQPNRAAATPYAAIAGPSQFSAPTTIAPSGDMDVDEQQKKMTDPAGGGALDPEAQAAIHERGRLKCLMELGHLDAVVDQALGTIQRTPSLEPALAPLGVEASWRLMQWSDLSKWLGRIDAIDNQPEMSSLLLPEDAFNVSVGKLFLSLRLHEKNDFDFEMTEARRTIMQALSAASMESYRRAYPLLVRLQILQELEEGFTLITSKTVEEKTKLLTNKWFWEPRIESMSPSMTHRSFVLATRRTLLGASGLPHLVAENWVDLATRLSHLGRYEAARIALQYAGEAGLDVQECVLRESRLLKEAGHVHKALMLLEPVEPDFYRIGQLTKMPVIKALSDMTAATAVDSAQLKAAVDHLARTDPTCSLPPFLTCLENKIAFSERLLLGTQLVIDCRAKHGSQVIERYQCLVDLRPSWELAHFHLARYHEYLYHEFKRKDLQDLLAADTDGGKGRNTTQVNMTTKGKGVDHSRQEDYCSLMCSSLRHALKSYCKSIVNGSSATTLTQALPRMLTLWFSCTSPEFGFATARAAAAAAVASGKSSVGEKETQRSEKLALLKSSANKVIVRFKDSIEAHIWFACMPQLVSRTGHKNPETLSLVKDLVLRVLTSYPQQGVWHIAGLVHSLVPARKKIGEALITEACAELKRKTDTMYNQHLKLSTRTECAEMLLDAKKLFQNLVELAALQHKDRRLKWLWPCDINNIKRILVPNQHVLARAAPIVDTSRTRPAADTSASSDQGATFQYIQSFNDMVDVAASKAKPKTIYLTTTSGGAVKFLCKQEKNGDLRKDARMMEFNTVINRLLQHDLEGRRRNLRLRTYAVVCLNEECGILEWVGNTTCIRHLIRDSHQYYPQRFNNIDTKAVYHPFLEMQEKHQDDMAALVHQYQHLVLNKYQPCFHRWFIERFSDPTAWLESRLTFTRSCAIWAVVGHVVGLGDRHTENVLLDTTNGECVHVDFDCLFDKGLQLARPEIVPFRLTPNLVDAMGLTGVEGVFRRTMEVSMSLLRENKETLLSVLEPFLRDPTVAWGRGGRAQRQDVAQLPKGALNAAQKTTAEQSAVVEAENPEVKEALEKITGRLNGIYNLTNPAAERIHRRYLQKSQPLPAFGMGAGRDEAQSLSVQGQVARLIDEAKAVENLAQMYIGWTPWQ